MECDDGMCCCFPVRGPQGFVGKFGIDGFGPQGTEGYQGSTSEGLQGMNGFQGLNQQGPQGLSGAQGTLAELIVGPQGVIGFNALENRGRQGMNGTQGTQGFIGIGTQGPSGNGTVGPQGKQGTQGFSGGIAQQGVMGITGFRHENLVTGTFVNSGFSRSITTSPYIAITFPALTPGTYYIRFECIAKHDDVGVPPNNVLFDLRSLTTILGGNRIITANNYRPQSIVIPVIANLSLSDNTMRIVLQTASGTTYFEIQNVNLIYIRLSS